MKKYGTDRVLQQKISPLTTNQPLRIPESPPNAEVISFFNTGPLHELSNAATVELHSMHNSWSENDTFEFLNIIPLYLTRDQI